ncbi:MAG TPA: AarF/UbiB family protein [Candidatus Sulfotelmatobacter sp.]
MLDASAIAAGLSQLPPQQLRATLASYLPHGATAADKIQAIENGLRSPLGQSIRAAMALWIVDEIVPVEKLVPKQYLNWRAPVRDSMMFVVARLSPERLAPKLLEQIELPFDTPAEVRLLRLIAKVPGLQKLGQVIARNQHLHPALRKALARLENGIRDVRPEDIRSIVLKALGDKANRYQVEVSTQILKEASVSAVIRFSWKNPQTGVRERGVFKVLKPHIPAYFSEDMDYLQGLAEHFGDRHHTYGFPAHLIPDTFKKVRRLLRHEVNFRREQKTLLEAAALYRSYPAVHIPKVIQPLCTNTITALSEERGIKVTNAVLRLSTGARRRVAEQLVEALIAVPLLSSSANAVFHGDPHAGNLLYHSRSGELVILDWALRERLNREQRRHLALLFLMVTLRDPSGVLHEITALAQHGHRGRLRLSRTIRQVITEFLDRIPTSSLPSVADAMRLLENIAMAGTKFPASLIMLSKVMFTLEGILGDLVGADSALGITVARHIAMHWVRHRSEFRLPLVKRDWITLQCSALLLVSRLGIQWQQTLVNRWLKPNPSPAAAS